MRFSNSQIYGRIGANTFFILNQIDSCAGAMWLRPEIEEAIEALYELQISVKDIATMIGIGERRVREYVDLHGL